MWLVSGIFQVRFCSVSLCFLSVLMLKFISCFLHPSPKRTKLGKCHLWFPGPLDIWNGFFVSCDASLSIHSPPTCYGGVLISLVCGAVGLIFMFPPTDWTKVDKLPANLTMNLRILDILRLTVNQVILGVQNPPPAIGGSPLTVPGPGWKFWCSWSPTGRLDPSKWFIWSSKKMEIWKVLSSLYKVTWIW